MYMIIFLISSILSLRLKVLKSGSLKSGSLKSKKFIVLFFMPNIVLLMFL